MGAAVDVNEVGKVCLMADGRTTETHFTRWLSPNTNFLIDLYFVDIQRT